jgi:hypothetical protein
VEVPQMIKPKAEPPILNEKKKREPKVGAFFAGLRILGGIIKWTGIVMVAGAVLLSGYWVIRATLSYLQYREQRIAGFITMLEYTNIAVFFICFLVLGICMALMGILMRRAGTRKTPTEGDRDFPTDGGQTPDRPRI